ncbi:MAG: DoxX family protein [Pseudomonadota bacterium]
MYWISTIIIAALLAISAYTYFFVQSTIDGVRELGFPDFFRVQLATLKVLAAIVLVTPQVPTQTKEWAYAGVALFLLTAIVAHTARKDPVSLSLLNLIFFAVLTLSNYSMHRLPS